MGRLSAPFKVIWAMAASWFMVYAHALTDLQGKTSKFLLVYGARAAPRGRGVATLGAGLAPSFVEGFGAYIPDDDPDEPSRALACDEHLKAEICRVAGCKWETGQMTASAFNAPRTNIALTMINTHALRRTVRESSSAKNARLTNIAWI